MKKVILVLLSALLLSLIVTSCKPAGTCAAYGSYEKFQKD